MSLLLTVLACTTPIEAPPEIDLEGERASLMQADRDWFTAYSTSDIPPDAIAARLLADVFLLAPDAPLVQGSQAFRAVFEDLEAIPEYSLSWEPAVAEVGSAGDLGYTIGTYEMRMAPQGTPMTIVGKYMTVWKNQADGSWQVAVDMFNADGPPTVDEE